MIDTDKYEGHTVNRRDKLGTFKGTDIFVWDWFAQQLPVWASKADAQLIADAPLLLEEVKRLRGLLQEVADEYTDADGITYEIYCEFREGGEEE
tara:strand:- start:302 stop:583 length:282 start_codon:yes stop_codon:yes gene_type:complete